MSPARSPTRGCRIELADLEVEVLAGQAFRLAGLHALERGTHRRQLLPLEAEKRYEDMVAQGG